MRAPFDGVVSERKVSAGDTAQVGKELVKVIDPRSMRFEGLVSADRMHELQGRAGGELPRQRLSRTRSSPASVRRIDAAANATTRQVEVMVDFADRPTQPRVAGLFAEGRIETGSAAGLTAARERAACATATAAHVWRVQDGQASRKVAVALGERDARSGDFAGAGRAGRGRPRSCATRQRAGRRPEVSSSPPRRPPAKAAATARRRRRATEEAAMFLSDFSIKRPVAMVVIIIGLMGLGLLALTKLRVNQIPDVEQPVLVVNIALPRRLARDGRARDRQPHREGAAGHRAASTRCAPRPARATRAIVLIFNFDKNMVEAADEVRNAIGSVRHKLPMEMREPVLQRVDPAAQPIMQLALSSTRAVARRDLAPGRRRAGRPLPRHRRAWPWST